MDLEVVVSNARIMKWKKLSETAIESGRFTISKAVVNGVDRFTLWELNVKFVINNSAKELKKLAEERLKPHEKEIA
jgi:hypothetical protein